MTGGTVGPLSSGKERKKRKRGVSVVEGDIDALLRARSGARLRGVRLSWGTRGPLSLRTRRPRLY